MPISVLIFFAGVISAQTGTIAPSPSPAPSKTSIPINTLDTSEEAVSVDNEEDTVDSAVGERLVRSFTQSDLSVLVANVQRPNGLIWLDNRLYAACSGDWTLYEIQADSGATVTFLSGIQDAQTLYAEALETGFNIWVPDFDRNALVRVDHRRSAPALISSELNGPWGIVPVEEDGFLVTNLRGNDIVFVSREGDISPVIDDLRGPAGIAMDGEYVYFANNGSTRRALEWFTYETDGIVSEALPLVTGLQNASNLVLAEDGFLYFTYSLGTRGIVGRIHPEVCRDSSCTNDQVEIVVYSDMPAPLAGLTISPEGRVYFHTIYRPEIYWVDLDTQ